MYIKIYSLLFILLAHTINIHGQSIYFKATIYNEQYQTIQNALIRYNNKLYFSDSVGGFSIPVSTLDSILLTIEKRGYLTHQIKEKNINRTPVEYFLKKDELSIRTAIVSASKVNTQNQFQKIDLQLRPNQSSQDLLRLVPGLFIAQHAGGGKAEQIFLRGFDVDHGTDFAIYVDGMPVNMISHAHGQGYADLHFLIPETVKELDVVKGPYSSQYGDLATAGAGEFKTLTQLNHNSIQLEYGMYNTQRVVGLFNLLKDKHILTPKKENFYIATEYKHTDAFFQNKQNFNRANIFAKYTGEFKNGNTLTLNASGFHSFWNASGQIPQRSIDDGSISRLGSIDNTEGGQTSRYNTNLIYQHVKKNIHFKHQLFYNRYDFTLFSNFTFFLNDTINGDQIKQKDNRNILGYNTQIKFKNTKAGKIIQSTIGIGLRYDNADIQLAKAVKREFIHDIVNGKLNQLNMWLFADENIKINEQLQLNLGARLDNYIYNFQNKTEPNASGIVAKSIVSPKLNLSYRVNNNIEILAKIGSGFHSNDARAVVIGKLSNTLPRAIGQEIGITFKPFTHTLINIALWRLSLESELIYVGDEGIVEASGRTRRYGIDCNMRTQLSNHLYFDADINYNKGRLVDEAHLNNFIPLAPVWTSTGGISYKKTKGLNGSVRYRTMGNRPANEDYSLIAKGYFLTDATINYNFKKLQLGIAIENVFNTEWNEAQFATESKLRGETLPVEEIHFTPGTPFNTKCILKYNF